MKNDLVIRETQIDDSKSIADLCIQLDGQINTSHIRNQVQKILNHPDHFCFVALNGSAIVGFIHCFNALRLTSEDFIEIAGLVVVDRERKKGVGRTLVQFIEQNCAVGKNVRVRCNVNRKEAHQFYEQMNYTLKKEQSIFVKQKPLVL